MLFSPFFERVMFFNGTAGWRNGKPAGWRCPAVAAVGWREYPPRHRRPPAAPGGTWTEKGQKLSRSPSKRGDLDRKRPKTEQVPVKEKEPGQKKAEN